MIFSIFYLILAILGLGFLIFIHELGHYIVARRVGMTVEVFSIGFGPPLKQWNVGGVKWQLSVLPFGGYVRIAGMEKKKGGVEPHEVPDGFYGKKPSARIKVALAGPVANILFAFVAFCIIWATGGQEKPFQQYTNVIGYVDPQSKLYSSGVRPGDEITSVDGRPIDGFQDLLFALMMQEKSFALKGNEVNYFSSQKEPFSIALSAPSTAANPFETVGIAPAQYLVFDDFTSPLAPLKGSGIEKGDRIVWVDGELIFSKDQLSAILNDSKALLTIDRNGQTILAQVPRVKISDLRLLNDQKNELDDWQHAAGLKSKLNQLYFIPYDVNHQGIVEGSLAFMNAEAEEIRPEDSVRNPLSVVLQSGDQIIAVDGTAVSSSIDLMTQLQARNALIIVQRGASSAVPSWKKADAVFENSFEPSSLMKIVSTIGSSQTMSQNDNLVLLSPVTLKSVADLQLDPKFKAQVEAEYSSKKKMIEKIENPVLQEEQLALLEKSKTKLMLGAALHDRLVSYNPPPTSLFSNVFDQTWKTLTNLITGSLPAKALSGPVGIVQALQYSWSTGIKDALFWLGFVSLNLAILNLLPIPVLDGGHILFASIEGITKKPIKAKTMERFIIPFLILLVGLFIYLTYQDIIRLISRFF